MFLLLLLLSVSSSVAFQPSNCGLPQKHLNLRQRRFVIGGEAVTTEEYPWIIGIKSPTRKEGTSCTGTLISGRHVLIAAHCFGKYLDGNANLTEYVVCLGIDELRDELCAPEKQYEIEKVDSYKEYFTVGWRYDIAVLTLSREVENVVPACLPIVENGELRYNGSKPKEVFASGYSRNNPNNANNKLKMASMGLPIPCGEGWVCVNQTESGAACGGDSGGPLTEIHNGRHVVIGVLSNNVGNICIVKPGEKVRGGELSSVEVGQHLDFIFSAMKRTENFSSTPSYSTEDPVSTTSPTSTEENLVL